MKAAVPEHSDQSVAQREFLHGSVLMVAALLSFTANVLLIRYLTGIRHVDVWSSVFVRAIFGVLFVLAVFQRTGGFHLSRVFTRPMLASRGLLGAMGMLCYYWTIPKLGVGVATLIANTFAIFSAILAAVVLRERLTTGQILAHGVALLGVAFLVDLPSASATAFEAKRWASGIAILGAIIAGIVVVGIRHLRKTESAATIFSAQCIYGVLLALPLIGHALGNIGPVDWSLLLVAALCATLGQLCLTEAFRYLTVNVGGVYNLTLPIWVSLAGVALFQESFSSSQVLGGTLTLLGGFFAVRGNR